MARHQQQLSLFRLRRRIPRKTYHTDRGVVMPVIPPEPPRGPAWGKIEMARVLARIAERARACAGEEERC